MDDILIRAEKISKFYRLAAEQIEAIKGINIDIRAGEFVAIMGPSGSGKTSLLDILGCLARVSSGKLHVLGADVSRMNENSLVLIRRRNIGFVFQDFLLIPTLTALENVELPLLFDRLPVEHEKTTSLLKKIGLGHRINHLPKQLSGGEKQRVAIARALITSPKIIFADEPTGNLDSKSGQQIFDILRDFNRKDGLTIVLTTHNYKLALQADRIIYLQDGKAVPKEESALCQ